MHSAAKAKTKQSEVLSPTPNLRDRLPSGHQRPVGNGAQRQAGRQLRNFRILSTKDATIRGKPAKIIIQEGTTDNNVTIRQELVAFAGKSGTAMLMVMAPVDQWNQAAYDKMVKSIK